MSTPTDVRDIAELLVRARKAGRGLAGFPGSVPADLATAYRIQDAAISLWSETTADDALAGWKIGFIAPDRRATGEPDRLVGPIWRSGCRTAGVGAEPVEVGVFGSGFAAVEAELVVRVLDEPDRSAGHVWTAEEVADVAYELLLGVEVASSPIPAINDLGPTVIAADFGNNNGLVLGPVLDPRIAAGRISCAVDGVEVGTGSVANLPGGLHHALATAWTVLARRGHRVSTGMLFATGAITGIHEVTPGQTGRVQIEGGPMIDVRTVDLG